MPLAQRLLIENGAFLFLSTLFLTVVGWSWRNTQPYELPKPLPDWFKFWFGSVQFLGSVPPLIAMVCALWQNISLLREVLLAYFVVLALQVLTETLALRQFQTVAWVMVPYLYVPYRLWQLWEGYTLTTAEESAASWLSLFFIGEIVVWGGNYLLDLAQLPSLLRWPGTSES